MRCDWFANLLASPTQAVDGMADSNELYRAAVTSGFGGEPAFMAANDYRIRLV
ncbi:hypothetical protein [Rhodopirellula europaea]|uniref:hypothetical protein n=1 Tax=Rhodopirellula europaea TaxID=1263866 RepID=UPI00034C57A3|nr:hypothetical protein [Rhodopirellula europaea]